MIVEVNLKARYSHLSGCFMPQNFGRWQGPRNDTLSSYECRFSGGDSMRWWRQSNPTLYISICLHILQMGRGGQNTLGASTCAQQRVLSPFLEPKPFGRSSTTSFFIAVIRSLFKSILPNKPKPHKESHHLIQKSLFFPFSCLLVLLYLE